VKTNALAIAGDEHDVVFAGGKTGLNEGVARDNLDCDDAATADIREIAECGFLYLTFA